MFYIDRFKKFGSLLESASDSITRYLLGDKKYYLPIVMLVLGHNMAISDSPVIIKIFCAIFPSVSASAGINGEKAFGVTLLGYVLVSLGIFISFWEWVASKLKPIRQIIIQSTYQPIHSSSLKKVIDPKSRYWKRILNLNSFEIENTSIGSIEKYKKIIEREVLKINRNRETFYCGISHIPFVAYSGHLLRNYEIRFLEIDHNTRSPLLLSGKREASLKVNYPLIPNAQTDEASLVISISRLINSQDVLKVKQHIPIINYSVEPIAFSNIKSEKQIELITFDIRKILDELYSKNVELKKIHLFYAGPTSLIFRIGQIVSSNTDKEIIVYNYDRDKGYCWGISINNGGKIVQL